MSKSDELVLAVADAVSEGRTEAERLRRKIYRARRLLTTAAEVAQGWGAEGDDLSNRFTRFTVETSDDLSGLFRRQRNSLSSFNISFFGRTGAGKSTLLTIFSRGDGSAVSPDGRSDWTTEIQGTNWKGVRLVDTPGIDGWGASKDRVELEAVARGAVETSDLVILCFDNQSQQDSEFRKVAAWVREYGKPVLAVLNVRDSHWRDPRRAQTRERRADLNQSVAEHWGHIRTSLDRIGLGTAPVVTINSRRAMEARARTPFRGPDREGFDVRRAQVGKTKLDEWSNFGLLESLLVEAVRSGSVDLRLAALRDGATHSLTRALRDLEEHQSAASDGVISSVRALEQVLAVVGYPSKRRVGRLTLRGGPHKGENPLRAWEAALGRPLEAPTRGNLEIYTNRLLAAKLEPLRRQSLDRAEDLVHKAFNEKGKVTQSKFRQSVYDEAEVEKATQNIYTRATKFAASKIQVALETEQQELQWKAEELSFTGDRTRSLRHAKQALGAAGLLSSTAAAMGTFALTNFWNPLGWGAGAAAVVAAVGSAAAWVFSWFRRRTSKDAERKQAQARAKMASEARARVNKSYDDLALKLSKGIDDAVWKQSTPLVRRQLALCMSAATIDSRSKSAADKFRSLVAGMPPPPDPGRVLSDALGAVARTRTAASVDALCRGEDWLDWGLEIDPGKERVGDEAARLQLEAALVGKGVDPTGIPEAWRSPRRESLEMILRDLDANAGDSDELTAIAADARATLVEERRVIAVVGDYSAGKSTLIKRLLIENGQEVPPSLQVSGSPKTTQAADYSWGPFVLRDTPGFQSGDTAHDTRADAAVAEAFLVLALFHKNTLVGDATTVRALHDDPDPNRCKSRRAAFLVSRSDELVTDPLDSPAEFARASAAKVHELMSALGSLGVHPAESSVWCLAADPHRVLRGQQASPGRDVSTSWDGITPLCRDILRATPEQLEAATLGTAAEGMRRALRHCQEVLSDRVAQDRSQERAFSRLGRALSSATHGATELEGQLLTMATDLCRREVGVPLDTALTATTDDAIAANFKLLSEWWKQPSFKRAAADYEASAKRLVEEWRASVEESLGRALADREFRSAGSAATPSQAAREVRSRESVANIADPVAKTGRILVALGRDGVYEIGKAVGYRFKPWEAVRLGARMGRIGAVLGAAGVALDAWEWSRDEERVKHRSIALEELRQFARESTKEVANRLAGAEARGDSGSSVGAVAYLAESRRQLVGLAAELDQDVQTLRDDLESLSKQQRLAERCLALLLDDPAKRRKSAGSKR